MATRDKAAFAEFVTARSGALHRAAYLMVGDVELAQDLVQEALTKTYVAWPRLREAGNAEAYTRKVITNTAISWFRKKSWKGEGATTTGLLPELAAAGHAEGVTDRAALMAALAELPPRQRAAIVLRFYDDLTEAQTAAAMDCAVGTVKSQVSAGLSKLRTLLGDAVDLDDLMPAGGAA